MLDQSSYLIYGLQDPFTYEIRYVGRSCSGIKRPRNHFCPNQLNKKCYKSSWIKHCVKNGKKPRIIILETLPTTRHLNAAEKQWIQYFRNEGIALTNHTDGGDGIAGYRHSEATKQKLRIAFKGSKHPNYGKTVPAERKKRISETQLGRKDNKELRLKKSIGRGATPFEVTAIHGDYIGIWINRSECSRKLNLDRRAVQRCLKGESKTHKKYRFKKISGGVSFHS